MEKGIVWMPYVAKTVSVSVNGETVWHANVWKNLCLKIRRFFIRPKYMKNADAYKNKQVNPGFYCTIEISKQHETGD
jgi:hypothetical protein